MNLRAFSPIAFVFLISSTDAAPTQLWQVRSPNLGTIEALAIDSSGNIAVTGSAYTSSTNTYRDFFVSRYSSSGSTLWAKRYSRRTSSARHDYAADVAVDPSGNVFVVGKCVQYTDFDIQTVKFAAATGSVLWARTFNGPGGQEDYGVAIATDSAGYAYICGQYHNADRLSCMYTAKYGPDGYTYWTKKEETPGYSTKGLALDSLGNVFVAGTVSYGGGDTIIRKYSSTGVSKGIQATSYDENNVPMGVVCDSSNYVAVTVKATLDSGKTVICTTRYDTAFHQTWERTYEGPSGNSEPRDIAVDSAGNVYITGFNTNAAGNKDIYVRKYATSNGAFVWSQTYDGPAHLEDIGKALVVDHAGNVIVTGQSQTAVGNADYATLKYSGVDGTLLWAVRKGSPSLKDDIPTDIGVDSSNNVFVTGTIAVSGGSYGFTIKYSSN